MTPYDEGFDEAVSHIANNCAYYAISHLKDQDERIEWERGYEHCIVAYRLGHDVSAMSSANLRGPSLMDAGHVIERLLNGTWGKTLPDPRK